jgi:ribonuclease BN (tRNA processing enzyme)
VDLNILGAGPAYTSRAGATGSSYLVRADGAALVLDLGQGSFSNLAAVQEPSGVSAVLVTHLHPDHFVDLVPLRHYLKWEFDPPRRLAVVGPAGLADRLNALSGEADFVEASLDMTCLTEGGRRIGPFQVEARRVEHVGESYAFRVALVAEVGPGLVYSGDCGDAGDLVPLIRKGDTLLCEATFGADPAPEGPNHITSADAARAAAAGGASRLLLTHVLAGHSRVETLAAAQAEFGGSIQLVTEGDRFEV